MKKELSELFMYGEDTEESILRRLADMTEQVKSGDFDRDEVVKAVKQQLKRLLELATDFGFDGNLWHNYIAYFLAMNENPFSLVCERKKLDEGTVREIVRQDMKHIRNLFFYDFSDLEKKLGINSFSLISDYRSVEKNKKIYNRNVSKKVRELSERLEHSADETEIFNMIEEFYREHGVGLLGLNKAFRIEEGHTGGVTFTAINNMDDVTLDDLVGYELQKKKLVDNTEAFVNGARANNVLLYGDSGTGKSTCIKAIINQYHDRGLRMIELYKHQFRDLSYVISAIKKRNYRFIIYMDDLSFEDTETEYKFLKAVIEGGVETRPDNVLIYATSNRRHLIKESWNDKNDHTNQDDIHHSDTVEEKLSLSNRFGVTIGFFKPLPKEYEEIVIALAKRAGLDMDEESLIREARAWEMSHGGISGRTAQQFIDHMMYR